MTDTYMYHCTYILVVIICVCVMQLLHCVPQKRKPPNFGQLLCQILTNFKNSFTSRLSRKFAIQRYVVISPYLTYKLLYVPRHNLSFGSRAFRVSAPKVWNTLPLHIRQSQSLSTFKRHLKTHYFQLAYPAT